MIDSRQDTNNSESATSQADWNRVLEEQGGTLKSQQPSPAQFRSFDDPMPTKPIRDIDMVLKVPVQLSVELGRTQMPIKEVLQLVQGSVIELDTLANEPMKVFVNGSLVAQGEVVVVNERFGIRLTDIFSSQNGNGKA